MASNTSPTVTAPTTASVDIGEDNFGETFETGIVKIRLGRTPVEAPEGHLEVKEDGTIGIGVGSLWVVDKEQPDGSPHGSYLIKTISHLVEGKPRLAPEFPEGTGEEWPLEGPVRLDYSKAATWHVSKDAYSRGWLITADALPPLVFPSGSRVYLVAVNGVVSWKWFDERAQADVPEGSLWKFLLID